MNNQKKTILTGAGICIIGLLVTYLSYWFSEPGSTYTIASGAIVVGAYEMIKGLVSYLIELKKEGNKEEFRKWILIGAGSLAAVAGLAFGGWKFVHKDDLKLLDTPQTVVCKDLPIAFTIPENFEEVEMYYTEATDSSYASCQYCSFSNDRFIIVDIDYDNYPDTVTVIDQIEEDMIMNDNNFFNSSFLIEPESMDIGEQRVIRCAGIKQGHEDVIRIYYDMMYRGTIISACVGYMFNEGAEVQLDQEKLDWADNFLKEFSSVSPEAQSVSQ